MRVLRARGALGNSVTVNGVLNKRSLWVLLRPHACNAEHVACACRRARGAGGDDVFGRGGGAGAGRAD